MNDDRLIAYWLLTCCAILLALVMVGGATRLTGSGLSIVEWRPVTGVLPPMSEQAWQKELEAYRQSPEYRTVNRGMSMDAFKTIFWWEWWHRFLARFLGLAFALPLIWFWARGRIPGHLRWPLVGILCLGGLQGYMGWFMVQSGLVDIPRVSPYRLAAHLALALLIYAAMLKVALGVLKPVPGEPHRSVRALVGLVALTIVSGAFVAGLKAGYLYNTFPLMAGQLVPDGLAHLEPGWRNFFENPTTVQFIHRLLGVVTLVSVAALWFLSLRRRFPVPARFAFHALMVAVVVQVTLGISTLLMHVPVALGTLHQGGAVILLSVALSLDHLARR